MLPIQATSLGHALDVASTQVGVVHSLYPHAINLVLGRELWTLLAAGQSDLPFGIGCQLPVLPLPGLRSGQPVHTRAGFVGIGSGADGCVVDCRAAARWRPGALGQPEPGLGHRLAVLTAAAAERWWRGAQPMAQAVTAALLNPPALRAELARVVGCGPGLTPSGDDVLVGILAVLRAAKPNPLITVASQSLCGLLQPLLATTTSVSAHLLRQAMDGLFGRSVHELMQALLGPSTPRQLDAALRRVMATGASSGADTCAGIVSAARLFLLLQPESVAA